MDDFADSASVRLDLTADAVVGASAQCGNQFFQRSPALWAWFVVDDLLAANRHVANQAVDKVGVGLPS